MKKQGKELLISSNTIKEVSMKILSYNIYGVKNTNYPIPKWEDRQKNISRILNEQLQDNEIKIACFQEVNKNNIDLLSDILNKNNFTMLEKFPMKTESIEQYNIVAVRNNNNIKINYVYCLPHGKDNEYQKLENQEIDYNMSDYRTTVFVNINYNNNKYLIGNIHTDYISTEGKIKGAVKSLNYMDTINCDYKMILGDMNMISHMSEVYNILKQNDNYVTLSRNKNFDISDNSWQGYGTQEQVNVDFAFINKNKKEHYEYEIVKQQNMFDEGSDHRPILITITN